MFTDKTQFRLKKATETKADPDEESSQVVVALPPFTKRQLSLMRLAARLISGLHITLQDIETSVPFSIQYHLHRWCIKEAAGGRLVQRILALFWRVMESNGLSLQ